MSMCQVAYTFRGTCRFAMMHYAQATLDWQKYHQKRAAELRQRGPIPGSDYWLAYHKKMLAFHEDCAKGFDDDIDRPGCEKDAGENGFWIVNTDEDALAWCSFIERYQTMPCFLPDETVCHIDFDAKTMTARPNEFCEWWEYLPDGWTFVKQGCDE